MPEICVAIEKKTNFHSLIEDAGPHGYQWVFAYGYRFPDEASAAAFIESMPAETHAGMPDNLSAGTREFLNQQVANKRKPINVRCYPHKGSHPDEGIHDRFGLPASALKFGKPEPYRVIVWEQVDKEARIDGAFERGEIEDATIN